MARPKGSKNKVILTKDILLGVNPKIDMAVASRKIYNARVETPETFKVTFRYPNGDVSHEVPTIEEGLAKLDLAQATKGKCVIQLDSNGKHSEISLYPMICKRVLLNSTYRSIVAKRLLMLQK